MNMLVCKILHLASCPFHFKINWLGDLSTQISNLQILSFLGYDKLKPYGFPIHGAVDGFSRRILWLEVTRSNNDPKVVAAENSENYIQFDNFITLLTINTTKVPFLDK